MGPQTVRILVVRRDNIGDLVCTTPLLAALRRQRPDAHIAALVNSYNAGVLAGNPDVDAVHVYTKLKHRGPGESWLRTLLATRRLLARLRAPRFDHVILAKSGFDRQGLALARRLAPRNIIGYGEDEPVERDLHEVEVVMKLGARLGVTGPPGPLRVFAAAPRVAEWKRRLPAGERRWIALHISARVPHRIWPVERFVRLAQRMSADRRLGILLLWAPGPADDPRHPGDDARAAAIASAAGPGVTLFPAKTESLEDLVAVLSLCDAFVGPDGGAMHIAAGLALPVVAMFDNVADKQRHWHPWQVPHEIVSSDTGDIVDMPVERAAEAWARLAARVA